MIEYMTVSEFAAKMKCGQRTVWRWIEDGQLRVWRRGRTVRIPADEALPESSENQAAPRLSVATGGIVQ